MEGRQTNRERQRETERDGEREMERWCERDMRERHTHTQKRMPTIPIPTHTHTHTHTHAPSAGESEFVVRAFELSGSRKFLRDVAVLPPPFHEAFIAPYLPNEYKSVR
jgi:hypothetical protein